jgi:hypothetical protein
LTTLGDLLSGKTSKEPERFAPLAAACSTLTAELSMTEAALVSRSPGALMDSLPEFAEPSWARWREIVSEVTDETREVWVICGRGAGKSRVTSVIAASLASRTYKRVAGEKIFVQVIAPDRRQAKITFSYISGLISEHPDLFPGVTHSLRESMELSNGVVVEVGTASVAAPRGRSYACVLLEEAAFLPQDESANPDTEILRALRPGLARVPGSILCVLSSPYARKGELYRAYEKYHLHAPKDVVFVKAPTLELNPSFDASAIEKAMEDDPAGARAEYLAEFRTDVESFVSIESVRSCVIPGRTELAPAGMVDRKMTTYHAFTDPSGGSQDSFTLAIGHLEERGGQSIGVIDAVRETRPKFSPDSVVAEYCDLLRSYGIKTVVGDRYGGEWPVEVFSRYGVIYSQSAKVKSDIYRDCLPLINAKRAELIDSRRLVDQFVGLERRVARGGKDSIDHGTGGHDDVVNVVAGVLVEMLTGKPKVSAVWGRSRG